MKKQMLFLGVLLSLSGLATAKNHEMTKESLSDSTNKNQLFYQRPSEKSLPSGRGCKLIS